LSPPAGHYIPTLAKAIVDENAKKASTAALNLKGFAIGNPYTVSYPAHYAHF
jgi:carboxypeptidase C (cathepsin A)